MRAARSTVIGSTRALLALDPCPDSFPQGRGGGSRSLRPRLSAGFPGRTNSRWAPDRCRAVITDGLPDTATTRSSTRWRWCIGRPSPRASKGGCWALGTRLMHIGRMNPCTGAEPSRPFPTMQEAAPGLWRSSSFSSRHVPEGAYWTEYWRACLESARMSSSGRSAIGTP